MAASDAPCIDLRTPSSTITDGVDDDTDLVLEENSELPLASSLKRRLPTPSCSFPEDDTFDVQVSNKQKLIMSASSASSSTAIVQKAYISAVPHCRHKCLVHRFDDSATWMNVSGCFDVQTQINRQTCEECYCFICDTKASSCKDWEMHCNASHKHHAWVNLRARNGVLLITELKGDPLTFLSRKPSTFPLEFDTDKLGLEYTLKRWQRMMVDFMLKVEQYGVSQKLFESRVSALPPRIHGGVLACECGMGKTGATVALMSANPVGLTLFVVPPLAVDQTLLEMKKFNKNLKVECIYGPTTATEDNQLRIVRDNVDVVILSSGSKLSMCLRLCVRRVIIDEAHVTYSGLMPHTSHAFAMDFLSTVRHVWCISGTPFETTFDDKGFIFQGRLICKAPVILSKSATIDDAQALVLRLTKNAFPEHKWPTVIHAKLSIDLSAKHREMYDFLSCFDAKLHPSHRENSDLAYFATRTTLRRLFLGENYDELQHRLSYTGLLATHISSLFKLSDTMDPSTLMAFKLKFDAVYHNFFNMGGRDENPKADAVMDEIKKQKDLNANYVAIIVTESTSMASYFESSGLRIGVLQPRKARAKYQENKIRRSFEDGEFDVLVCSFMPMSIGLNLQLASELFFIDLVTKEDVYSQAIGRISRLSSLHDQVKITSVCVKDTIGELYCDYWADRRKGILSNEAVKKLWDGDKPHCMKADDSSTFYRIDTLPSLGLSHSDGDKHFNSWRMNMEGSEIPYSCDESVVKVQLHDESVSVAAANATRKALAHVKPVLCVINGSDSNALIQLTISNEHSFMLHSPCCKGFRVTIRIYKGMNTINECTFNIDRSNEVAVEASSTGTHTFAACIPFDYANFRPDPNADLGYYVYPCVYPSFDGSVVNRCLLAVDYIIVKDDRPTLFCPILHRMSIAKCSVTHCSICGFHRELKLLEVQHAGNRKFTLDGDRFKSITDGYHLVEGQFRNPGTCFLSVVGCLNEGVTHPTDRLIDLLYEQRKDTFMKDHCLIDHRGNYVEHDAIDKKFFEKDKSFTYAIICLPEGVEVGDMVEYTFNDRQQIAYVDEILVIPFDDGELKNCVKTWVKSPFTDTIIRIMASKKKV